MINFDEYKKLGEPDKLEKSEIWKTAIGLQEVDGLQTSEYLHKTAKSNIDGDLTFRQVHENLASYYKTSAVRQDIENRTEEADKVSAKIAEILSEKAFVMSPAQYLNIHKRIFEGFKYGGKVRTYNITKDEWVLNGETIYYASANSIMDTLKYDFDEEKSFDYRTLNTRQTIYHIADFLSGIWQIHPFGEGNTRATAVFAIKYLRTFGFDVENDMFANHSWYFRNALVRANYTNLTQNIYPDKSYLYNFFENLLCKESHSLQNRQMLLVKNNESDQLNDQNDQLNDQSDQLNDQLNQVLIDIISLIKDNPKITMKELGEQLNVSPKTISRRITQLKSMKKIERIGSLKTGYWKKI